MEIFSIIIFLFFSGLFSGSEIAFISANKLRVELWRKKKGFRGKILAKFYDRPADFLGTMLVGNNVALVVFTSLMTSLISPFVIIFTGGDGFFLLFINSILITIVVLIFGEFLPKTLFRLFANETIYALAYPLRFLQIVLLIPAWIMTSASNFILKYIFRAPTKMADEAFTRLDLENFVSSSRADQEEEIDIEMFGKALNLKDVRSRDCMIPRTEIEHIDVSATIEELEQIFKETKLSRIVVIKDDIDHVLGYVHHQQLLAQPQSIRDIILDVPFIPGVVRVTELLNKFIKERINIACVVDEFGGVAGIITLEDIIEEIFGEIEDEHDQEEYVETQISENEFIFSGRLEIDYLNEKYEQLAFPEGEYQTLSGYLVTTTENIPEQGAEIELENFKFILELVSDTKIETIRVVKLIEEEQGSRP